MRACDWLPGRGMPREAFDPEKKCLPLCELYNDDDEDGLPSPGAFVHELRGAGGAGEGER